MVPPLNSLQHEQLLRDAETQKGVIEELERERNASRLEVESLRNQLASAKAELVSTNAMLQKSETEHAKLVKRYDFVYAELAKVSADRVAASIAARESQEKRDTRMSDRELWSTRTMAGRMTGLFLWQLPEERWVAALEALNGAPPRYSLAPSEPWTLVSAVPLATAAMPTAAAACLALLVAANSAATPQGPMLAHLCTLLLAGRNAPIDLLDMVLRGVCYHRQVDLDHRPELLWLVTIAARASGIDIQPTIAPMVAELAQPFLRLIETFGDGPINAMRLRELCGANGILRQGGDLGFLEGNVSCLLVEFKTRTLTVVDRKMLNRTFDDTGPRADIVEVTLRKADGSHVDFETSMEETERLRSSM
ncbi:hypothetical protein QBC39DRAFT_409351 [Podospora conica]|nr:hypothetical protein QBC39DRAFT_409351 [Schizothecium conicum]